LDLKSNKEREGEGVRRRVMFGTQIHQRKEGGKERGRDADSKKTTGSGRASLREEEEVPQRRRKGTDQDHAPPNVHSPPVVSGVISGSPGPPATIVVIYRGLV